MARAIYGILGEEWPLHMLLYADDTEMTACNPKEREGIMLAIFIFKVFGGPLKQKKVPRRLRC